MTGGGTGTFKLTGSGSTALKGYTGVTTNAAFSINSSSIQVASVTGIRIGMTVSGSGIAANSFVKYITQEM